MKILFSSIDISGKPETSFKIIDEKNSSSDSKEIRDTVAANIGFVLDKKSDFAKRHDLDKNQLEKFIKYLGKNNVEIEIEDISKISEGLDTEYKKFSENNKRLSVINGSGSTNLGSVNKNKRISHLRAVSNSHDIGIS